MRFVIAFAEIEEKRAISLAITYILKYIEKTLSIKFVNNNILKLTKS